MFHRLLRLPLAAWLLPAAACLAGCNSEGAPTPDTPRLDVPDDPGLVEIPMEGTWRVTGVDILEQFDVTGAISLEPREGTTFRPPFEDVVLEIAAGEVVRAGTDPLRIEDIQTDATLSSYLNRADGRVVLYDLFRTYPRDPGIADGLVDSRMQIALGAIADDTLEGLTSFTIEVDGGAPADALASGLYRVRLERQP